jgi:hypothetical protein
VNGVSSHSASFAAGTQTRRPRQVAKPIPLSPGWTCRSPAHDSQGQSGCVGILRYHPPSRHSRCCRYRRSGRKSDHTGAKIVASTARPATSLTLASPRGRGSRSAGSRVAGQQRDATRSVRRDPRRRLTLSHGSAQITRITISASTPKLGMNPAIIPNIKHQIASIVVGPLQSNICLKPDK